VTSVETPAGWHPDLAALYDEIAGTRAAGYYRSQLESCGMLEWMRCVTGNRGSPTAAGGVTWRAAGGMAAEDIVILIANMKETGNGKRTRKHNIHPPAAEGRAVHTAVDNASGY
jgi:hypothetical protein